MEEQLNKDGITKDQLITHLGDAIAEADRLFLMLRDGVSAEEVYNMMCSGFAEYMCELQPYIDIIKRG